MRVHRCTHAHTHKELWVHLQQAEFVVTVIKEANGTILKVQMSGQQMSEYTFYVVQVIAKGQPGASFGFGKPGSFFCFSL